MTAWPLAFIRSHSAHSSLFRLMPRARQRSEPRPQGIGREQSPISHLDRHETSVCNCRIERGLANTDRRRGFLQSERQLLGRKLTRWRCNRAETQASVVALASRAADTGPLRSAQRCRSPIASAGKARTRARRDASSAPSEMRPSLSLLPPCCFQMSNLTHTSALMKKVVGGITRKKTKG